MNRDDSRNQESTDSDDGTVQITTSAIDRDDREIVEAVLSVEAADATTPVGSPHVILEIGLPVTDVTLDLQLDDCRRLQGALSDALDAADVEADVDAPGATTDGGTVDVDGWERSGRRLLRREAERLEGRSHDILTDVARSALAGDDLPGTDELNQLVIELESLRDRLAEANGAGVNDPREGE